MWQSQTAKPLKCIKILKLKTAGNTMVNKTHVNTGSESMKHDIKVNRRVASRNNIKI